MEILEEINLCKS